VKLDLRRVVLTDEATVGDLSVDGVFECFTLEDRVRAPGVKVPGKTAIPAGRYEVKITWSPRFRVDMPLLLDVPGFQGVRIHPGNTAEDTEGCILVGKTRMPYGDALAESRKAYASLFRKLKAAQDRGEPISIEVR
jgi:hypothetical protein